MIAENAAETTVEEIDINVEDSSSVTEPVEESADSEAGTETSEEESFEVIDTGDEGGSQPTKQKLGVSAIRRIRKLKHRAQNSESAKADVEAELRAERDKNQLLLMERSQRIEGGSTEQPPAAPNPDDFLYDDEGYQKALKVHNDQAMARSNQTQVREYLEGMAVEADKAGKERTAKEAFRNKMTSYDDKLNELNIPDAVEIEESAIEAMGQKVHDFVILNSNVPHLVTIWAGKNPEKARELAELANRSLPQALMKLGELESRLKVRPKASATPQPDNELEGSRPSAVSGIQRQYDKLLKQPITPAVNIKRRELRQKAKAEGVRLN